MSFEGIVATLGTFGTIMGLVIAIGIFFAAARLVTNARKGNRRIREARGDPHTSGGGDHRRDIPQ
jgi:hypothetical protein